MKKLLPLLLLGFGSVQAQLGGQSTFQFLNVVPSARVAGQGGNAIANTATDLNFALWNPALLNPDLSKQVSISMIDYVSDIVIGEVGYAQHFEKLGTFSLSTKYISYGDFDRTNTIGIKQGTFTGTDLAVILGYGYQRDTNWSFGANLKYINSKLDVYSSNAMALDAAISYQIPSKRMAFSLVAKNMGFQFDAFHEEKENLPFEIQMGFSNRFEHLPLRWMVTLEQLETWDLRYDDPNNVTVNQLTGEIEKNEPSVWNNALRHVVLGAEFAPTKGFNLQFGYSFRRKNELDIDTRRTSSGISFGVGIKVSKFRINYARNNLHIAGGGNNFSIVTQLQDFKKKKPKNVPSN